MIKKIVLIVLTSISALSMAQSVPTSGSYVTDETSYFVSGMKVNEALERVNLLLCYLANTNPVTFVNKNSYVATIYEQDCTFKGSSNGQANATKQNSGSGGGGSGGNEAKKGKKGNTTYVNITQTASTDPMDGKLWILLPKEDTSSAQSATMGAAGGGDKGGDGMPFDATVYLKHSQTASASSTSKIGDFTMQYSLYSDALAMASSIGRTDTGLAAVDLDGKTGVEKIEAQNFGLGNGYVSAQGQTVKFKEGMMGMVQDISITYDGTSSRGIYSSDTWDNTYGMSTGNGMVTTFYAFIIDDANNFYCEKLIDVKSLNQSSMTALFDFDSADGKMGVPEGEVTTLDAVNISDTGLSQSEICYSTNKADAIKNVYSYGVYNTDGSRVGATGGPFPIRAESAGNDDYYGWADYWGVWVDTYGRAGESIDPSSLNWKRDDGNDTSGAACQTNCAMQSQYVEVTKYQTSYRELDSIDKLNLSISPGYDWGNASKWEGSTILNTKARNSNASCTFADYQDVNNNVCFETYNGYWDASNDQLVITHGMKWAKTYAASPSSPEVDITDINISAANWVTNMNYGSAAYPIDLSTYSTDTWERFQIPGRAFISSNHNSVAAGIGIKNEKITYISPAELATDLGSDTLTCIEQCIDPALLNSRFQAAADLLSDANTSNDNISVAMTSIYDADAHGFHDVDSSSGINMERYDGLTASYAETYVLSGGDIYFQAAGDVNNKMTIFDATKTKFAAAATKQDQPAEWLFGSLNIKTPGYDAINNQNDTQYIGYSARTGFLVPTNNLSQIECNKDGSGNYLEFDSDHPRYSGNATLMDATRYCYNKYLEGGPTTYYEISVVTAGKYELTEGGVKVVINQPANLDFDPADLTDSQKTAGGISADEAAKTYKLFFGGFGDLHGIPGGIFNTCTNEDMGEYFYGNWDQKCHKWASKFIMPDGTKVTDKKNTTSTADDVTYFVKPIRGEEYLTSLTGSALSALPSRNYTGLAASDISTVLATASNLLDVGPNGSTTNYIGTVPTTLLNSGNPSVLMGETLVAP